MHMRTLKQGFVCACTRVGIYFKYQLEESYITESDSEQVLILQVPSNWLDRGMKPCLRQANADRAIGPRSEE